MLAISQIKNTMISALWLIVLVCGSFFEGLAQERSEVEEVKVIARIQKNSVLLRWGVTTPSAWMKANTYGYQIQRFTISRNGVLLATPEKQLLTSIPIKPKPLQEWETIVDRDDYAAVLAQALYGESFEVEDMQNVGAIAQIVNKSKEIEQRFSFAFFAADMSFEAAKMAALGYEDTTILTGEEYLYRIETVIPKEVLVVKPGTVVVKVEEAQPLPGPLDLIAVPDDKTILLTWEYELFRSVYNSYYVEKSEDGKNFKRLGDQPSVNLQSGSRAAAKRMQYVDTLSQNDKTYYYRVKGISPFGEESTPSKVVSAQGIKKLTATPQITKHMLDKSGGVSLEWEFLQEAEKQIAGFELNWAPQEAGPYQVVQDNLPPSSRKTTYKELAPSNYFKITAVGKSNQKKTSFTTFVQTIDSIPPARPLGLTGRVDTLGIVTLQWQANTEKDIRGYRIFRGNLQKEDPVLITKSTIAQTTYRDTVQVKILNKDIFYQIIAVDQRHNMSEYSEKIVLQKPDVIPPSSPIFSDYKVRKNGVFLEWIMSSSEDVATHQLYRQNTAIPEKGWELLFKTTTETSFLDTKTSPKQKYRYAIFAQDTSQLLSAPSTPITVVAQNSEAKSDFVKGFTAVADRTNNKINLNWRKMPADVVEILIYKSKKEEKPVLWKQISGTTNAIQDASVSPNNIYVYQIKAMTASGIHSKSITKEILY